MNQVRYTFSCLYVNDCIYVIGGREFGSDETAIYKTCEKYDFQLKRWIPLPMLNENRCTTNIWTHNGRIYVAGGYTPSGNRTNTIEILNE